MPGMLWNDAPICTSTFGTVYDPRNFTCGSHFCSMWQVFNELLTAGTPTASISTSALLPAFAGSSTSQ